jgi:hypothetical protein
MKPPRKLPPLGTTVSIGTTNGGLGMVKLVKSFPDVLLYGSLNRNSVSWVAWSQITRLEVIEPDGRVGTVWGN